MEKRGATMFEENIMKYTALAIEFNPKREETSFNIRNATEKYSNNY